MGTVLQADAAAAVTAAQDTSAAQAPMNAAEALLEPALSRGMGASAALLFEGRTVSYDQLDSEAKRFAAAVTAFGLGRTERVLLMLLDRPEFFYAYLGTMRAGGVAVGLNVRAAAEDLAFVIADSGARLVLANAMFLPVLDEALATLSDPPQVVVADKRVAGRTYYGDFVADHRGDFAAVPAAPDDMAFWMYTSGTTGAPKGAIHRHRTVLEAERFLGDILGVKPGERVFCSSKLFFAFALGHCFFGALRCCATAVLYEGWPSSEAIAEVVETYRPAVMFSVPTFYRNLLRDGTAASEAFRHVRHFVSAGEKLPETLFERWRAVTGTEIVEGIGATETVFLFLVNRPGDTRAGSCGMPAPGAEVRLLDEMGETITEPGLPGTAWVRMGSLAAGYWNQPERTGESFRDGWYRTGDMFARDGDGFFHHQGRGDDMLKISGQWVSPAEIEEAILRNPKVADAAVVGIPNSDGLIRLAMFLVPADATDSTPALAAELQETLCARLSIYKCPRRVIFLDEMPRTATGKVQRFVLRQMAGDQMGLRG